MISSLFKDTKPYAQVLTLLLTLICFVFVASALMTLALSPNGEDVSVEAQRNIQLVSQILTFFCPALLFAILFGDGVSRTLKLSRNFLKIGMLLCAIVVIVLSSPISDCLTRWNNSWHLPESLSSVEQSLRNTGLESKKLTEQFLVLPGGLNLLLNLIVLALVPAICEECFFRGALQESLCRWLRNPHCAIILSAAIFSLMHGDFFAFLPRFFLGIVLGYIFYCSGSIWTNIAAHFANNAIVVIAYFLYSNGTMAVHPDDLIHLPWWCAALSLLLMIVLFVKCFIPKFAK